MGETMKQNPTAIRWRDIWNMIHAMMAQSRAEPVGRAQKIWCGCILAWEGIAPKIWPYGLSFFIFLVAALFDLLPSLPGAVHSLLLVGLTMYWIYGAVDVVRAIRWPDDDAIYHRIEQSSDLPHRPLTSLRDQMVERPADPAQLEWWHYHQARLKQSLRQLTVGLPRYGFAPSDPYAIRSAILLLVMIGVIHAGRDIENRMIRAFKPDVPPASSLLAELVISVKPPEYTGLPQINLKPGDIDPVSIVTGSKVFVQFSGVTVTPTFYIDGDKKPLTELAKNSYQTEIAVTDAYELRADIGWQTLGRWPVQMVADNPPAIDWDGDLYATSRAAMRVGYHGSDDFGITAVDAVITKPGESGNIVLHLPVFTKAKADVKNASYHDVAYHRWAGDKVQIQLIATDAVGHKTNSKISEITLPERDFKEPVAREIAAARKEFMFARIDRAALAQSIESVIAQPQKFAYDARVTLGLRVAATRAAIAHDNAWNQSIIDLLWDIALRIEDSGVSLAEKDLRNLEQQLQDAMARGASPDEINALLDQFQNAMESYMNAMMQQMVKNGSDDLPSMDNAANSIEAEDVGRLLMQIRALMQSGNNQEAQKLLSKLQEIMANIRSNQGQQSQASKAAMELVKSAQALIRDQQKALDDAAAAMGRPEQKLTDAVMSGARKKQKEVLDNLKKFQKQLSQTGLPESPKFSASNRDMNSAIKAIDQKITEANNEQNKREQILAATSSALENLRSGMQDMMKNMQQSGGAGQVRAGGGRFDPFGRSRPGQGMLDDPSIKVPGMQELQRSQEILDELQRRSGDYSRPEIERDYIKRLLRRF